MSIEEQKQIKTKYYNEAIRYMDNAKDVLKKSGKEGLSYIDDKYVKMACGTAYSGVLVALDGFFIIKEVNKLKKDKRKDKKYYESGLAGSFNKILDTYNEAYKILHLYGYYDGVRNTKVVAAGFELAYEIIEKIKP